MIVSAIVLLLPAPLLAVSPMQASIALVSVTTAAGETAHAADETAPTAANGGLSVQRICKTGGPSMFSGRARKENCELTVVQPRCKSSAPSMFSGRARREACEVVMERPYVATSAPAIFSGRAPRAAKAYASPTYSYAVAADGTATPQVTYQTAQESAKKRGPSRLPSMFTGRRPRPRAPAQ
jgi:hypothetical protein